MAMVWLHGSIKISDGLTWAVFVHLAAFLVITHNNTTFASGDGGDGGGINTSQQGCPMAVQVTPLDIIKDCCGNFQVLSWRLKPATFFCAKT